MKKNVWEFIEKIKENPERNRFVILIVTGLIFTVISWFYFPPDFPEIARISIIWLVLSMGLYWAVDRIIHSRGIKGETERDGVIWLVPLAWGWVPVTLAILFIDRLPYKTCFFLLVLAYCCISTYFVTRCRPEIPENHKTVYIENIGWGSSIVNPFQLFKYKMEVSRQITGSPVNNNNSTKDLALSLSYLFYTVCFGIAAIFASTKEAGIIKFMEIFAGILGTGTAAMIAALFAARTEQLAYPFHEQETPVLSVLFCLAALNIGIFLFYIKGIY